MTESRQEPKVDATMSVPAAERVRWWKARLPRGLSLVGLVVAVFVVTSVTVDLGPALRAQAASRARAQPCNRGSSAIHVSYTEGAASSNELDASSKPPPSVSCRAPREFIHPHPHKARAMRQGMNGHVT